MMSVCNSNTSDHNQCFYTSANERYFIGQNNRPVDQLSEISRSQDCTICNVLLYIIYHSIAQCALCISVQHSTEVHELEHG